MSQDDLFSKINFKILNNALIHGLGLACLACCVRWQEEEAYTLQSVDFRVGSLLRSWLLFFSGAENAGPFFLAR